MINGFFILSDGHVHAALGKKFNGIKHGTESGALPLKYAYTSVLLAINHGSRRNCLSNVCVHGHRVSNWRGVAFTAGEGQATKQEYIDLQVMQDTDLRCPPEEPTGTEKSRAATVAHVVKMPI
ncbi:hypothetical protein [Massilia sp. HP4]|uniref:hypothetical protein n=1 Tax=Massilia sp. HP4 TaxID=2562316 RepID=UPI001484F734|nr:hypothetical protein [Massilia sp. HP4]